MGHDPLDADVLLGLPPGTKIITDFGLAAVAIGITATMTRGIIVLGSIGFFGAKRDAPPTTDGLLLPGP